MRQDAGSISSPTEERDAGALAAAARKNKNHWRRVLLSLVLAAGSANAAPDAGNADPLRSGEHKALIRQTELMRVEVAKPRGWHERDKVDKLKAELTAVERVLEEVETLYGERLAACRARWIDASEVRDPTVGAHPGYYACASEVWVTDGMVRLLRRKDSVATRLQDRRLTSEAQRKLREEQKQVDAELDKLLGNTALYMEPTLESVDGGIDGVPEGRRNPP